MFIAALSPAVFAMGNARALSFGERVAAQRAIEQVWWSHRTTPEGADAARAPFDRTLSQSVLSARVEDGLRKSNALERLWGHPLSGAQIQAELDRIMKMLKRLESPTSPFNPPP